MVCFHSYYSSFRQTTDNGQMATIYSVEWLFFWRHVDPVSVQIESAAVVGRQSPFAIALGTRVLPQL